LGGDRERQQRYRANYRSHAFQFHVKISLPGFQEC
jgi:hypothetical protein